MDKSISLDTSLQTEIKMNPEIFSICKSIVSNMKKYLGFKGEELDSEVYYLFKYLLTSRFNSFDGIVLDDRDLADQVTDFLFPKFPLIYIAAFHLL